MSLYRRIAKLERQSQTGSAAVPSLDELGAACEVMDRHARLTFLSGYDFDAGTPPDLPEADRAFLAECEAGALARAHDIRRRYMAANGYGVDDGATARWLEEMVRTS